MLVCFALTSLPAATHDEVLDLLSGMAAALTAVNPAQFMDAFDKSMPDYGKLKDHITALANQAEITSSIELLTDEGDDAKRSVDLDWYLQVRSLYPNGPIVTRREVVHCELGKQGKRWKIVALKPIEFFAPVRLDR